MRDSRGFSAGVSTGRLQHAMLLHTGLEAVFASVVLVLPLSLLPSSRFVALRFFRCDALQSRYIRHVRSLTRYARSLLRSSPNSPGFIGSTLPDQLRLADLGFRSWRSGGVVVGSPVEAISRAEKLWNLPKHWINAAITVRSPLLLSS